ncbi:MAG TPA: 2-amino-4-hydroxy-6-hydroxymethyldihydropteridine diphosphokinase [Gemmataceae bacterium]|nr:2-amino-4-hydroxy-6-hydroxymethyldihydropteridine diphosphokinase [Gemmataceae bacterium]
MTTAFIALGSNLGDRNANLLAALQALQDRPGIVVKQTSSFYETEPVGGPPGQGLYLNAAARVETRLTPRQLLQALLEVEAQLGRQRQERFGPRTIDLDLLLFDDQVIDEENLTVPHPRLQERLFVLEPLAEIAPKAVHPILGLTIRELLRKTQPPFAWQGHELKKLRAVVTGSSSGIGKAIALELARAGADIVVHCGKSVSAGEEVAGAVRALGVRSQLIQADLRDREQCRQLVKEAWREWRRIDIWVNNAGADTLTGEAAELPFEFKLRELLAVDVTATMLLSRLAGAMMKEQGQGVILNMGWDQAETGMAGDSGQLFAASKAAVMAFSKSLALTLAPEVRVNCLAPGWIRTAWGEKASQTWQDRVVRETPLQRWGTPEDVAQTARWLVSPAAAFITGQIVRINGGAVR